jgi:hypothetical protein
MGMMTVVVDGEVDRSGTRKEKGRNDTSGFQNTTLSSIMALANWTTLGVISLHDAETAALAHLAS